MSNLFNFSDFGGKDPFNPLFGANFSAKLRALRENVRIIAGLELLGGQTITTAFDHFLHSAPNQARDVMIAKMISEEIFPRNAIRQSELNDYLLSLKSPDVELRVELGLKLAYALIESNSNKERAVGSWSICAKLSAQEEQIIEQLRNARE